MVITIRNTDDFIRALRENEEFRDAARRELLTEDLLNLPGEFREFRSGVEEFMVGSNEFRSSVEEFMVGSNEFRAGMEGFRESAKREFAELNYKVDDLRGHLLESKMHTRLRQRLGRELGLDKVRVIWMPSGNGVQPQSRAQRFSDNLDRALETDQLTSSEVDRLLDTDMIVWTSRISDGATVYVAVEASGVMGVRDIDRARESARVLTKLYDAPAIPAVYGFSIASEQTELARSDPDAGLQEVHVFPELERF